jgi:hypothetical protein
MNHRIVVRGILALAVSLLLSAAAHAQAFRTYLSAGGNDGNPCTLVAPCRLLPAAIAAVADGGEVWMIDSANYNIGPVNVNKSVTILAVPGALGSVIALATQGGNAINITTRGVKVALRNLVIVPYVGGGNSSGITMVAGLSLTVEKCLIANLLGTGISVSANGASVLVMDTVIKGNGGSGLAVANGVRATVTRATISGNLLGVLAGASLGGSTTTVDITDSTIDANGHGVFANSNSTNFSALLRVSVRDSQVVRNSQYGLIAQSNGGLTTLSVSNNIISNNNIGLVAAGAGAKVWASGNTVSDNVTGLWNDSALIESAGDNAVRNNGADTNGAISAASKM